MNPKTIPLFDRNRDHPPVPTWRPPERCAQTQSRMPLAAPRSRREASSTAASTALPPRGLARAPDGEAQLDQAIQHRIADRTAYFFREQRSRPATCATSSGIEDVASGCSGRQRRSSSAVSMPVPARPAEISLPVAGNLVLEDF